MLGISIDYKVDLSKILSYPITPVSLSMCHLDGNICKTDKSALMKCLEKEIQHEHPRHVDVLIIDVFFPNTHNEKRSKEIWKYFEENDANGYSVTSIED